MPFGYKLLCLRKKITDIKSKIARYKTAFNSQSMLILGCFHTVSEFLNCSSDSNSQTVIVSSTIFKLNVLQKNQVFV